MAENINKLAEEYAYTNWESDDYHEGASEGLPFDPIGHTEKTYKAGVEMVLKKVEEIVYRKNGGKIPALLILISELKEE